MQYGKCGGKLSRSPCRVHVVSSTQTVASSTIPIKGAVAAQRSAGAGLMDAVLMACWPCCACCAQGSAPPSMIASISRSLILVFSTGGGRTCGTHAKKP